MTLWALTLPSDCMPGPYCKSRFSHFVLWSKVRRGGAVHGQARWQVDGAKPMIWWFITLSYTPHHNILRTWDIVVTTLDSIQVLKFSQNQIFILLLGLTSDKHTSSGASHKNSAKIFFRSCGIRSHLRLHNLKSGGIM